MLNHTLCITFGKRSGRMVLVKKFGCKFSIMVIVIVTFSTLHIISFKVTSSSGWTAIAAVVIQTEWCFCFTGRVAGLPSSLLGPYKTFTRLLTALEIHPCAPSRSLTSRFASHFSHKRRFFSQGTGTHCRYRYTLSYSWNCSWMVPELHSTVVPAI